MNKQTPIQQATLNVGSRSFAYYPISQIPGAQALPLPLKVLLENVLRTATDPERAQMYAQRIVGASAAGEAGEEVEFSPARVLFQDFTGVPVFVDFATMREACAELGGEAERINPQVPCNLVIDHSVIADHAGSPDALEANMALEFERNAERYEFLKWSQQSFSRVSIVPPGQGICHQVNVESVSPVVMQENGVAYFDTVVGTDSHTPTVNGIGVLGWGVGGIEAEAAALGQPVTTLVPPVVGVHLKGSLAAGVCAMDVALTFASVLRAHGVVGCFVECFGEGVASLSATQRACISNMTPEYGNTATLFPVDERTLDYLRLTGRSEEQVALVEAYAKAQGTWGGSAQGQVRYASIVDIDLSAVVPSVAGPSRPHDRFDLSGAHERFRQVSFGERALASSPTPVEIAGERFELDHGAIAIAAVTSCTTATDPAMMIACGLLAKNAVAAGLSPKPWVKTILAPGSRATELLLERAGLLEPLAALGFHTCGFGCMSCIGNSGPLSAPMHEAAESIELASVLSGNRNFEGRISPDVAQNYLMSPAAVVAYALAGTMDFDPTTGILGEDASGKPVRFDDIWPTPEQVRATLDEVLSPDVYAQGNAHLLEGGPRWDALGGQPSHTFAWNGGSTYVQRAPYFACMPRQAAGFEPIRGARVLAKLGDFITTDHISPAGSIAADSAAAAYLRAAGVAESDFNTYGARRGNHEVMMRGTFANVKLQNQLAPGRTGAWTRDFLDGEEKLMFDASQHYAREGIPLVVLAGKMYGSGSSRDWAAKGPALLGVRAVFAESYERIHRSNLIGMGIVPLQFEEGCSAHSLGLDGTEVYDIEPMDFSDGLPEPARVRVSATRGDGGVVNFMATVRVDTPTEGAYLHHGGILHYVLRQLANG